MRRVACLAAAVAAVTLATACNGDAPHPAAAASPQPTLTPPAPATTATPTATASRTRAPRPTPTPTPTPRPSAVVVAPFKASTSTVTAATLGKSWHSGCPVGPDRLRALTMTYWGFDGRTHVGTLVLATVAVAPAREAFRRMYSARFPIRRMQQIGAYGGDDNASMAADNTSAFNCRYAVADGPKRWSAHAYGQAIDIDPLENPYTLDGRVYPPAGAPYTHRGNVRPGMIVPGSVPVRAFSAVGWGWGGRWSSSPDYQHFSASGQ